MGRIGRIRNGAWITWLWTGAGDQAFTIYARLPERLRGWIEGYIIAPVVGAMTLVAFLIWGVISDLKPIYLAALVITMAFFVMAIAVTVQTAMTWMKRNAFEVRPVTVVGVLIGIGDEVTNPDKVYARIDVTSKRDVGECVAVVTAIASYQKGWEPGPMIQLLWNARYLSWTPEDNRMRRATILENITMTADLAVASKDDHDYFQITSADDGTRHKYPQGFYKIDLTIMSESGGGARRDVSLALTYKLRLGWTDERHLIVQPWSDELVKQKQQEDADQPRRKVDSAKAPIPSLPSAPG